MKPNPWISNLAVYEPGKPMLELARQLGLESEAGIVKLASNENAWGPSPKAQAAMVAAAAQMHLYPDGSAYYLRQELARRNGLDIEQVVVGNGSNELLEFLAHVYLDHGTNIVMADRAFVVYALLARAYQADVIRVPMRDLTHDLDALLAAVTPKTRLVFVANPNNPTGTKVTPAAVARFLQNLPDHVVAVFDEAYFEFLDPEDQPALLAELQGPTPRPNLYVLRTFSKAYGLAGLRLGYALAAPESARLLQRVRQPFNVNAMALAAGQAALDDTNWLADVVAKTAAGRAWLENQFRQQGYEYVPSSANFVLVKVGDGRAVFEALQQRLVIGRPMDGYGLPAYLRVTVGTPTENQQFIRELNALRAAGVVQS